MDKVGGQRSRRRHRLESHQVRRQSAASSHLRVFSIVIDTAVDAILAVFKASFGFILNFGMDDNRATMALQNVREQSGEIVKMSRNKNIALSFFLAKTASRRQTAAALGDAKFADSSAPAHGHLVFVRASVANLLQAARLAARPRHRQRRRKSRRLRHKIRLLVRRPQSDRLHLQARSQRISALRPQESAVFEPRKVRTRLWPPPPRACSWRIFDKREICRIINSVPTAELRPMKDGEVVQTDEDEIGLTYEELAVIGEIRRPGGCGPYRMFLRLASEWSDRYTKREVRRRLVFGARAHFRRARRFADRRQSNPFYATIRHQSTQSDRRNARVPRESLQQRRSSKRSSPISLSEFRVSIQKNQRGCRTSREPKRAAAAAVFNLRTCTCRCISLKCKQTILININSCSFGVESNARKRANCG